MYQNMDENKSLVIHAIYIVLALCYVFNRLIIKEVEMIYLIGGGMHCGKTSLAEKVARTLSISCLHVDSLEVAIFKVASPEFIRANFPKSWIRKEGEKRLGSLRSNDTLFEELSPEEITQALITQSRGMWDVLETFITQEVKMGRDIIVEGYHIHPGFAVRCQNKFGAHRVRAVFLIRKNIEKIMFYNRQFPRQQGDWLIEKGATNFENVAKMTALFSEFIERKAEQHHMPCVNTDSDTYHTQIEVAVHLLAANQ